MGVNISFLYPAADAVFCHVKMFGSFRNADPIPVIIIAQGESSFASRIILPLKGRKQKYIVSISRQR